jgi:hypothetical protein
VSNDLAEQHFNVCVDTQGEEVHRLLIHNAVCFILQDDAWREVPEKKALELCGHLQELLESMYSCSYAPQGILNLRVALQPQEHRSAAAACRRYDADNR